MINDSVQNLEFKKATDAIYWLLYLNILCIVYTIPTIHHNITQYY